MVVSPIEGVTNEHFVVWMRNAALPKFRKMYGYINQSIKRGEVLTFNVNANYEINRFKGSKTIFLSTANALGGKNQFHLLFFCVGLVSITLGLYFFYENCRSPRTIADKSRLAYKSE